MTATVFEIIKVIALVLIGAGAVYMLYLIITALKTYIDKDK